ncbi:MAG: M14 family zinc carboxypeptidase [Oscillospiraceae bacterium]|nr:M14 family zinc carboxypeptidase [Oscillospiraceae bacterium]
MEPSVPCTPQKVQEFLFSLRRRFPQSLRVFSLGRSAMGREIWAAALGNPRSSALFLGSPGAEEDSAVRILLWFCEALAASLHQNVCLAEVETACALESRGVLIVAQPNPDGAAIRLLGQEGCGAMAERIGALCGEDYSRWQANARGIDLRRQFPAGWQPPRSTRAKRQPLFPSPSGFGGYRPFSEPEAGALAALAFDRRIRHLLCLRAGGETIRFCTAAGALERSRLMASLLGACAGYRVSARPVEPGGPAAWFIDGLRRPAFEIFAGPIPSKDSPALRSRLLEALVVGVLL